MKTKPPPTQIHAFRPTNVDEKVALKNKLGDQKVEIPLNVIGTGKWNLTNWKTDAFYSNPLNGFIVP